MTDDPRPSRSSLERRLGRWFDDGGPRHVGSGWISGVVGLCLALSGLGGVIVLHFPLLLTSAELRASYPVPLMRALIEFVLGMAFLGACLNLLLRSSRRLGWATLAVVGAALALGGAGVELDARGSGEWYLGLDWFLLNLLLLAIVFVPLERRFPRVASQPVFRAGWLTDTGHFALSHVGLQVLTFLSLLPATELAAALGSPGWRNAVAAQPAWLQVIEVMVVADVVQYWVHRAFHQVPWLWPFHAVHHSSRAMDWLAGSRLHVVDVIVTRALVVLPVFALGFSQAAIYAWLVVIGLQAVFNHVNVRWTFGALDRWVATPRFHHWHHAVTPVDRNFAVHFAWLDRLFGTFHLPANEWPSALGIAGHPVPEGFWRQLAYPFARSAPRS